jgi:hypothetical protein
MEADGGYARVVQCSLFFYWNWIFGTFFIAPPKDTVPAREG